MKPKILLVTILPALVGVAAMWATHAADLYKWIDEKGQVHYTSAPPPETAKNLSKSTRPIRAIRYPRRGTHPAHPAFCSFWTPPAA